MKAKIIFLLIVSLFLIFGCTGVDKKVILGSERFVDNGDNSVTDLNSGLTWMKCNYGEYDKNCTNGQTASVSIGYMGGSCYRWDSFNDVCENGALCKDGSFQKLDFTMDYRLHPEEYSAGQANNIDAGSGCFFIDVPKTAKDRACEKHGGVSKYDWIVPSSEQLRTLRAEEFEENVDTNFFPTTRGVYLTTDSTFSQGPGGLNFFSYNFFTDDTHQSNVGGTLKCVSKEKSEPVVSGPFCSATFPIKRHLKTIQIAGEEIYYGETWIKTDGKSFKAKDILLTEKTFTDPMETTIFAQFYNGNYEYKDDNIMLKAKSFSVSRTKYSSGNVELGCNGHGNFESGTFTNELAGNVILSSIDTYEIPVLINSNYFVDWFGSFSPSEIDSPNGKKCNLYAFYESDGEQHFHCATKDPCGLDWMAYSYMPNDFVVSIIISVDDSFDESILEAPELCFSTSNSGEVVTTADEIAAGIDVAKLKSDYDSAVATYGNGKLLQELKTIFEIHKTDYFVRGN